MMYFYCEDQRDYWTGNYRPASEGLGPHPTYHEQSPYGAGVQYQTDQILADYNPAIYVRGWFGVWIYNLTHWIVSEGDMAHEALCEIARLKKEAT